MLSSRTSVSIDSKWISDRDSSVDNEAIRFDMRDPEQGDTLLSGSCMPVSHNDDMNLPASRDSAECESCAICRVS